jgi:hypothetical protein
MQNIKKKFKLNLNLFLKNSTQHDEFAKPIENINNTPPQTNKKKKKKKTQWTPRHIIRALPFKRHP